MATDDLGSMVVSFAANLDGMLSGQQQFIAIIDDIMSSADTMAESLQSLPALNAENLVAGAPEAEDQLMQVGQAATSMADTLATSSSFDGAGIVDGAMLADEALSELSDQATQTEQSVSAVSSASSEAGSSGFGSLLSGIGGAASGFMDFIPQIGMTAMGMQMLGNMVEQTASSLLQPAATAEQTQDAFDNLMHSTSAATDMLGKLNEFAAHTPFQTQDIDNAAEKLVAYGINAQSIIPDITGIGDALSSLGKNSPAYLEQIVDVFGKIQASGKLTSQDMMQLSSAGIPAWQMLAKAMGVPVSTLQDMVSKGTVPATSALQGLQKGMEDTFGGSMAKQASTFNGLVSTLASNWNTAMAAFGSPLLKLAEAGLENIGNVLSGPGFQSFAGSAGQGVVNVLEYIGMYAKIAGQDFSQFGDVLDSVPVQGLISSMENLGKQLFYVFDEIGGVGLTLLGQFTGALDAPNSKLRAIASQGLTDLDTALMQVGNGLKGFANFLSGLDLEPLVQDVVLLATGLGELLLPALDNLGPLIKDFNDSIGDMATFFEHGSVSAHLIEGALIGIGAGLAAMKIADFIDLIPDLVLGFQGWAVGAWEAAAGTIAATWPILAIGAAVGLVVVGIVESVQHWGEIAHWLQGAWSNVSGFFEGIWHDITGFFGGIGNWFHDRFDEAANGVHAGVTKAQNVFSNIGGWFHDRGTEAATGAKSGWQNVVDVYQTANQKVLDGFHWLYQHNTYFKDMVDDIKIITIDVEKFLTTEWTKALAFIDTEWSWLSYEANTIWGDVTGFITKEATDATNKVESIWNTSTSWLSSKWGWVSGEASKIWGDISGFVSKEVSIATGFLETQWNNAMGWLVGKWNTAANFADQMWQKVSGVFDSIWDTYVAPPFNAFWNSLENFWNNTVVGGAENLGSDLITAIANGIGYAGGAVGNAIHNAIGTGLSDLGFHDIPGFAGGTSSAPGGLSLVGENGPELVNLPRGAQVIPLQGGGAHAAALSGGSSGQDVHVHVYLDSQEVTHTIGSNMVSMIRATGPVGRVIA